ncbi:Uncharacterised protein [Mycobacteroides abscessus subsp. abscessus]|nr:Uncharacterised protein [Mycobacteroides abscessus subsp. abscessus]
MSANFVSPVSGFVATKNCQLPSAGLSAASTAPALGELIGPGGRPFRLYVLYGLSEFRSSFVVVRSARAPWM